MMADIHEPKPERERKQLARAGILVVAGVICCVVFAAVILLTHRPHTHELTPGQKPSVFAFLNPTSG